MNRLINTTGGSNKFWYGLVTGAKLTSQWGRVGSAGQSKTIALGNPAAAKAALEKLVAEKRRKGYRDEGAARSSTKSRAKAPTTAASPGKGSLLGRLEAWMSANRPSYLRRLRPGAKASAIERLERHVGAPLPAGLKAFLGWRNGQSLEHYAGLQGNFSPMSAAQIIETRNDLNGLLDAGDFDRANWWSKKWVPFLDDGNDDHLVIDLDGAFGGKPGQVLEFWHDETWRTVRHASFDHWLRTFVEALEQGLYKVELEEDDEDHEGSLQPNGTAALAKLTKRLNPGYPIKKKAG